MSHRGARPTRITPAGLRQPLGRLSVQMPTTFVTGGSGFIGGRLIERLVAEGIPSARSRARTRPPPR